jgi:1-acyl-sn-glycerol-3-phosphate acyltransferase
MKKKSLPGTFSMFIRSAIYSVVTFIFTLFYSLLCVACFALPFRYRFKVVMGWSRTMVWLLKVICCIDYHEEGFDKVDLSRNGIVMCKHQSAWETFFVPPRFHQTAIILKRELLWMPFFGWGAAAASPIAINRSDKISSMAQIIGKGKKYLAAGRWILVFPEGTRVAVGDSSKYRLGGARLAAETGYPVLPIAHNAGCFWPRRKFIKRPGTIQVVFGPLIESKGRTAEEILALTKEWIETTIEKMDTQYH